MPKNHSRYPYTYACDYLRGIPDGTPIAGITEFTGITSPSLSRADASRIMAEIAKLLGMENHQKIAEALADEFLRQNPDA